MSKSYQPFYCFISAFLLFTASASIPVSAKHHAENTDEVGVRNGIEITNAWARATFAMAKTGAGYFTLTNHRQEDVVLVSASVSEAVANMVELHETVMVEDMMRMRELEDGIVVPAGATVEFTPGGKHMMFMGLKKGLSADEQFAVELAFSDETSLFVEFIVKDAR